MRFRVFAIQGMCVFFFGIYIPCGFPVLVNQGKTVNTVNFCLLGRVKPTFHIKNPFLVRAATNSHITHR